MNTQLSLRVLWERMGSGVPSGLQNQYETLVAAWVSSILTRSRQEYKLVILKRD